MAEEKKSMFCSYCGAKMEESDKFCPSCGKRVPEKIRNEMKVPEHPPVLPANPPVQAAAVPAPLVHREPQPADPVILEEPEPMTAQESSDAVSKLSRATVLALPGGIFAGFAAVLLLAGSAGGLRSVLDAIGLGISDFPAFLNSSTAWIVSASLAVIMIGLIVLANRKRIAGMLVPVGVMLLIAGIIVSALLLSQLPSKRILIAAAAFLLTGAAVLIAASFIDRKKIRELTEKPV